VFMAAVSLDFWGLEMEEVFVGMRVSRSSRRRERVEISSEEGGEEGGYEEADTMRWR
jgi:hypothetical protein